MFSYQRLRVWQQSVELIRAVYALTRVLPRDEQFVLTQQMRRAAISVSSNIAEGYARKDRREYLRFLNIAFASVSELESQLIVAKQLYPNLAFLKTEETLVSVMKLLTMLIRSIRHLVP